MSLLVLVKLSIYVVLLVRTDAIAGLIEYLQDMGERRKFCAEALSCGKILLIDLHSIQCTGSGQSLESAAIYAKRNANDDCWRIFGDGDLLVRRAFVLALDYAIWHAIG